MLAGGGISISPNNTMDTSRYGDDLASKFSSSVWSPKGLCLLLMCACVINESFLDY